MSRLLTRLRASVDDLSPVPRRVAQYVLEHTDATIYHSVTEVSEATRSSEGSIIRFCQDLGFSGFQEFKLTLAVEFDPPSVAQATRVDDAGSAVGEANLMARPAGTASVAMRDTASLFELDAFEAVAERLAAAERVDVYGVGASGVVAQYYAYKFLRLGLSVQGSPTCTWVR